MKLLLFSEADRFTDTTPGLQGTVPYMAPEFLKQQLSKPYPTPDELEAEKRRGPPSKPFRVPVGPEDRVYFVLKQTRRPMSAMEILRTADALVKKASMLGYGDYPRPNRDEIFQAINNLEKRGVLTKPSLRHGSVDFTPKWQIA